MSDALRKIIMQQLSHDDGEISNIIYDSIQHKMHYNPDTEKFEIELGSLGTEYFKKHPERSGIVNGTNIQWKIESGQFSVWMK